MFDFNHQSLNDWRAIAALVYIIICCGLAIYRLTLGGIYRYGFIGWRKIILWPLYLLEKVIIFALGGDKP